MAGSEIPRAQQQLFDAPGGARAKYSALVVGRPGILALIKHECVVMLSQHIPGAFGLAMRKWLYPTLLGSCGRNVIFGQNVVLRHPHKIHIGDLAVVGAGAVVRVSVPPGAIAAGVPAKVIGQR